MLVTGLEGPQAAPVIAGLAQGTQRTVVVTATQGGAASLTKNLTFFLDSLADVFSLPEDDPPFLNAVAKSHETEISRLLAMAGLSSDRASVVVCPASMAIRDICRPETFSKAKIKIERGQVILRDKLINMLVDIGYRRVPYTETAGEFSARGDIVDIYPIDQEKPWRISFFDDEIENLRPFNPDTQITRGSEGSTGRSKAVSKGRSSRKDSSFLEIVPAVEPKAEGETLTDWADLFIVMDPERILKALQLRETEAMQDFEALSEEIEASDEIEIKDLGIQWETYRGELFWESLITRKKPCIFRPEGEVSFAKPRKSSSSMQDEIKAYEAKYTAALYGQLDLLAAELKKYLRKKFTVTIVASTESRLDSLKEFATQEGLAEKIYFKIGELSSGFELTSDKKVWFWDGDIFKSEKKSGRNRIKGHEKISAFTDIEKGDFIVHEKHGIGVYKGIKTIETNGAKRDYLTIAYSGKDILYLPVWQLDRVQKYIGGGEKRPRVNKLGSEDWTKTKARVRAEIEEYAAELINLAAERKLAAGFAFSPDTVWLKDFEDLFPYEPTPDQMRCFEAVRKDMENPWPMDRLICGDVGYGKTEVALRAIFKCIQDGKQAAMLVPTTILASQHFRTLTERFSDFPVRVEMLSRFTSAADQRDIQAALPEGKVDIVVGTHALISNKIKFKDLGLLVIDEEQRFGVKHKEKIRAMKAGVDVLTLTATPIPRTLNMSLLGIKDMELIEDPPDDRYPVRTFVSEERPDVISESIRRELDRGGQVYVVFNRVAGIELVAEKINALVPQARVAICHAKMNERMIEAVMMDFYENNYDVLLSTTIIESGLDIPNVNTIVILDADRLGLTQLYQLRGRVGRSNRVAFAYLMYRRDKVLTETAEKRLRTIREFTEFGSGFKVAMKDLEIRGAGNLLGVSQHGFMASVGYEMYCKLMDETMKRLSGAVPSFVDSETDCRVEMSASAVIPAGYIEDEIVKLQIYKRISFINDEASKTAVVEELNDRFGPPPLPVLSLIKGAWLRHLGESAGLAEIKLKGKKAYMLYRDPPLNLMELIFKASERANKFGATLEADVKSVPKLKLTMPSGASDEENFDIVRIVLIALSEGKRYTSTVM